MQYITDAWLSRCFILKVLLKNTSLYGPVHANQRCRLSCRLVTMLSRDLYSERMKASFVVEELTSIIYGKEANERRKKACRKSSGSTASSYPFLSQRSSEPS